MKFSKENYREFPNSSVIDKAGYDESTDSLFIQFKSGSIRAYYSQISWTVWYGFRASSSAGKYYNEYIKRTYRSADGNELVIELDNSDGLAFETFTDQKSFKVTAKVSFSLEISKSISADNISEAMNKFYEIIESSADGEFSIDYNSVVAE